MISSNRGVFFGVLFLSWHCVGYEAGIDVEVAVRSEALSWINEIGDTRFHLAEAQLVVTGTELVPCETHARFSSVAYAHEGTSGEVAVLDLVHDGGVPRALPVDLVLPDRYCGLRVHFGSLEGTTVRIEGWRETAGERRDLRFEDGSDFDVLLPFEDALLLEEPQARTLVIDWDPRDLFARSMTNPEDLRAELEAHARVSIVR
ncbi:MAG: hypothetical protein AAGE52_30555 [Myxococcota bacterium]